MSEALDQLARAYGILSDYVSETGERRIISDEAKRRLLAVMGVPAANDEEVAAALQAAPSLQAATPEPPARCYFPSWLDHEACLGRELPALQPALGTQSGIGDFADLAAFADIAAAAGADFIGLNPAPCPVRRRSARFSPYAPSDRRMLDWIYIAIDRIEGSEAMLAELEPQLLAGLRMPGLIDYPEVHALKLDLLGRLFRESATTARVPGMARGGRSGAPTLRSVRGVVAMDGDARLPRRLAWLARRLSGSVQPMVSDFANDNAEAVAFHCWLQWLANEQLAAASVMREPPACASAFISIWLSALPPTALRPGPIATSWCLRRASAPRPTC